MKETPAGFARRTGVRYSPPAWLATEARPLALRESCPTLFRHPGPEGLQALLGGALERLAPEGTPGVWLVSRPTAERGRAARLFGTVAVLDPLRLTPCATKRAGIYRGVNRRLGADATVWVPPSAVAAQLPWDRIRTPEQARRRFGPGLADEEARVSEAIGAYLEELSLLERSGAPPLERAWLAYPARERRARLAHAGVEPRWTRR